MAHCFVGCASALECRERVEQVFADGTGTPDPNPIDLVHWCF